MKLFGIGQMLQTSSDRHKQSEALKTEGDSFQLASNGGYIVVLKYALFVLFGFYNVRLFLVTVPGWEGYLTACFALLGEGTALYCFNNYPRSMGKHKQALGVFALLLFAFSFTHSTISFFRMEQGGMSGPIQFYCEHIAFPLLFGLLLLAAIVIPLLHWRADIAKKQAEAQTKIESDRAGLIAESAELRNKSQLEHERLKNFEEEIKIGNEYVGALRQLGKMKRDEQEALNDLPEPLRSQVASHLGLMLPESSSPPVSQKPVVTWRGGQIVEDHARGN